MTNDRTDEARWRAEGKATSMTLEQRADFIAAASGNMPGGTVWKRIRERALQQLCEAAAESWRHGFDAGIVADRDLSPRAPPAFLGLGVDQR
jgi:hypothetical protein